jgi:uncharacterized protein (TIRG00374 family)
VTTPKQWRSILPVVAVCVIALVALRLRGPVNFDWSAFRSNLVQINWGWLALAAIFAYATYFGRALRWAVFLRPVRPRPGIWNLLKATVIGFTAVTLLGRAGEIVRPFLIAVKEQVPLATQLAAWLLERLFDLLFALLIFGFGLSRIDASRAHLGPALTWALQTGGSVVWLFSSICLVLLAILHLYPESFGARLLDALGFLHEHHLARAEKLIKTFLQGIEALRSRRAVLELAGYTVLEWILIAGCYLCVMRSFDGTATFALIDVFIYMGFVAFGSVVQLPGIGGGMQVVSVLVLHEIFGVSVEMASSLTLVLWIITFVILIPIGVPLAFHEGINWRKVKMLREESPI